jgi:ABC-type transporter Mla MlaB component
MSPQPASPQFAANADVATSTVYARGELDQASVDLLWGTIDVLVRAGYDVTLDLAELSSVDEAGVRLLVADRRRAPRRGDSAQCPENPFVMVHRYFRVEDRTSSRSVCDSSRDESLLGTTRVCG